MDWDPIWLLFGGGLAGFVNALAGGGSALTIPLLMLLGLDATQANGTNRLAVLVQAIAATSTYHHREVRPWGATLRAIPWALGGAIAGALFAARMAPGVTARAFGVVFITLAVVFAVRPRILHVVHTHPRRWAPFALVAVGIYGGVFQAGVGIPFLLVAVRGLGLDAVHANALKAAVILLYTIAVVVIFGLAGQVDWARGAWLAAGGVVGSSWGARAAIDRGADFVRWMVLLALLAAGLKALFAP